MIRAVLLLGAAAILLYLWEGSSRPAESDGSRGGTILGLVFGGGALAIMLFCAALGLKRRVPHWRIGRAQSWLRGHIWLGLLSVLLVALHSAFHAGGGLTLTLWILLLTVAASGLFGVLLQQFIPRLLLHAVPEETLAQQIDRQLTNLRKIGEQIVAETAGDADPQSLGRTTQLVQEVAAAAYATPGAQAAAAPLGPEAMRRFYHDYLVPFFRGAPAAPLLSRRRADSLFAALRTMTTPEQHPHIDELAEVCERRRQLLRQRRLMRILFAWLLIHVPLSWGLLALSIVHAVIALRYGGAS